jgi:hypothetical protein
MLDKTVHGRAKDPRAAMPPMHPCESGLLAALSQLRVHSTVRSLFLEEKEIARRSNTACGTLGRLRSPTERLVPFFQ